MQKLTIALRRAGWTATLAVAVVHLAWAVGPAFAQQRYSPRRPTFSPWLNLYRDDTGPLDPYHSAVRPSLELRSALGQIDRRLQVQGAGLEALRRENALLRQEGVTPTGIGSTFMNYSHFYGAHSGVEPSAGRRASRAGTSRLSAGRGFSSAAAAGSISGFGGYMGF